MSPRRKATRNRLCAGRRARSWPQGGRGRLVAAIALVAVTAAGALAWAAPSVASAHEAPASAAKAAATAATSPFTAPSGVALTETPPPWALPADARPYIAAAGLDILTAEQLAVHYHAHLDIIDNGTKVTVPAGIGFVISDGKATGITVLHTHDTSGVIHIESARDLPYTLGQVFTEWGVALDATRIGGLRADADHVLAAYVNGKRFTGDPATLRLKRHLEIAIWYGPKGQTPKVPKSYQFPAGL